MITQQAFGRFPQGDFHIVIITGLFGWLIFSLSLVYVSFFLQEKPGLHTQIRYESCASDVLSCCNKETACSPIQILAFWLLHCIPSGLKKKVGCAVKGVCRGTLASNAVRPLS
ncbi:peripheral-type benzodiazepine receptor-associated protein 1-like [Platysternon megacephalum]|uniref:Peripheral-type benzodiazepine receptor-associated protein 1-like n=1 Tax=Platysternon megacephalum TaxID=55544 RepID=A0A4D9F8E6_9SAUR|nr:peripheral-type benzodiazepine receptor-associated protein 1-like [Platysternon megacephalum]